MIVAGSVVISFEKIKLGIKGVKVVVLVIFLVLIIIGWNKPESVISRNLNL